MAIDGGLRGVFRECLLGYQVTSIESGTTEAGIPDCEYIARNGVSGWLEMKKTDGWAYIIRPFQIGWIERRMRMGGKVYVCVRRKQESIKHDEIWVLHPSVARLGTLKGLGIGDVLIWGSGGPSRWPWAKIRELLEKREL